VLQVPAGGVRVEEVGRVLQAAVQPVRALLGEQRQVELRRPGVHPLQRDRQAGQGERLAGRVLQDEHVLEERAVAERPLRLQQLDQLLEGHLLVGQPVQGHLADPVQQLAEARVAAGVHPQSPNEQPGRPLRGPAAQVRSPAGQCALPGRPRKQPGRPVRSPLAQ
jgi:hypothetical protein